MAAPHGPRGLCVESGSRESPLRVLFHASGGGLSHVLGVLGPGLWEAMPCVPSPWTWILHGDGHLLCSQMPRRHLLHMLFNWKTPELGIPGSLSLSYSFIFTCIKLLFQPSMSLVYGGPRSLRIEGNGLTFFLSFPCPPSPPDHELLELIWQLLLCNFCCFWRDGYIHDRYK